MSSPDDPTLAGYLVFLRNQVKIPANSLPNDNYWIGASYNLAIDMVLFLLKLIPNANHAYPSVYALAVYNFATDRLVNIAADDTTSPDPIYFQKLRDRFKLDNYTVGVVKAASDENSSTALEVPSWAKDMSMLDLQMVKTPWGRTYMAIAQQYGPTVWGLT